MKGIYEPLAYGDRFWDETITSPVLAFSELTNEVKAEFAIFGGGYTGLFAALRLAEAGADLLLLDAQQPGWGASGRNGGLVSVGSAKVEDDHIIRKYGESDAQVFFDAERSAVDLVEEYLERHAIDADRYSDGYTYVAHNKSSIADLKDYGSQYTRRYGLPYAFVPKVEMPAPGLNSPDFHGAVHLPIGFALNPMKFVLGLTQAARDAGVRMFSNSPVKSILKQDGYVLTTPHGKVRAKKALLATNGYSSDDLPTAMANRYLPVQFNILVSRPLTSDEIKEQGWFSRQMVCDSRTLLHYFRLLPDNRMLFGLRGSVRVSEKNITKTRAIAREDFDCMFPAWRHVETPYFWSGLICMTRNLVPFAGALHSMENMWAAFGYHGGGVTMAPYAVALIADQALGRKTLHHPDLMQKQLRRFELSQWRRMSLLPAFAWYKFKDLLLIT